MRMCATMLYFITVILLILSLACGSNLEDSLKECFCKLNENVDDCNCKIDAVHRFNNLQIYPRLQILIQKDYFRYLPINLNRGCRFWSDDSRCALRDCHVKGCLPNELPKALRTHLRYGGLTGIRDHFHQKTKEIFEALSANRGEQDNLLCSSDENAGGLGVVDKSLSHDTKQAIKNWTLHDDQQDNFCELDDDSSEAVEYVDLIKNPERFTGYRGPSAHRVWNVIYKENCFRHAMNGYPHHTHSNDECKETRAFYRLISGLHSSISIHLCKEYLLKDYGNMLPPLWGPNVSEFIRRFHPSFEPEGPQRLKNLYFTYLFEMRALVKAAPILQKELYFTGNVQEGEETQKAIADLIQVASTFPHHLEESHLFPQSSENLAQLKEAFRRHFLNISRIMDCVGCDKCRLWGKLQVQGMGTALKILFRDVNKDGAAPQQRLKLKRTEIVSLVNALARLSNSIYALQQFQTFLPQRPIPNAASWAKRTEL